MQDKAYNTIAGGKCNRYLVIGGDKRSVELARILKNEGYRVATLGMEKAELGDIKSYVDIAEALKDCDVLIGPIPFSKDKNIINSTFTDNPLEMDKLFEALSREGSKTLLAGAMNKNARETAERYKIHYIDYYWDESYQVLNTIPTVEGTIAVLVNETDETIHDRNILVLGYGRIGKLLSDYLRDMGARVYVEARKDHDIAWIISKGLTPVSLDELNEYIDKADIIVNTIPAMILDKALLDKVKKNALIVDLASLPGGVDFTYAKELGIKTVHALGLPGKIAYKTAAKYMFDTIIKLLAV